ncbi:gamma-glutamyltransferase [Thalassoglobus polymorphus]|uniref:gamma-glutamyltransferase n=1 Tax=Thalassoglobus polymorphus TaxID=2527994 RepID=UPI0018D23CA4|nr:gamma-glutamyltransferase [Thalassoglobus polymorphus]
MNKSLPLILGLLLSLSAPSYAGSTPQYATQAMVVSQTQASSDAGAAVLKEGGNAIDAAVTTAFVLAVTHPSAGNIGGGGFLVYRPNSGAPTTFDFREKAPAAAHAKMWLDENGEYDSTKHHYSHLAVGVPGTVAGLHMAWKEYGSLPWERLVQPAIDLARNGFPVSHGLAYDLESRIERFRPYPASMAQFTKNGKPYQPGDLLKQEDLAKTLERIAKEGPDGFYRGKTAELLAAEMANNGGIMTKDDLANYEPVQRAPIVGTYRGHDIISMPPPSSGGITLVQMLNILEGFDLEESQFGSAKTIHLMTEAMRRAYRNRALHLGDPEANPEMPIATLTSKGFALELRQQIDLEKATKSSLTGFEWPHESTETTHFSIVDQDRNAVSLTYTLENSYGSGIVVTGGGFLLNNEMGDFNPSPGLTTETGLIGTKPNLTEPGKRMLSSMTPTIVAKDGELFMVTGSPGGRTIINTVLQTIVNVVDHKMDAQTAVDSGRFHHQWFPDRIQFEEQRFSPDTLSILKEQGHKLKSSDRQGSAHIIVVDPKRNILTGGVDRRRPDTGAAGF